jgi:hypothetical protein
MAPYQPTSLQVRPSTDDQRKYLDTFHLECGAGMECCIHFITERGIDLLADLAHATFDDGIAFGITRTCRTPMRMIYEVLCDENFFGSEEALFRFIPKPGKGVSTCKYHYVGLLRLLGFRAICHQRTRGSTIDGTDKLFLEKDPANSGCLSVALNDEGNLYEFYCEDRDRGGKDGKPLGSDRPKAKPKAPKAPKKSKKITDEASIKALMEQVRVLTEENTQLKNELGRHTSDSDGGEEEEVSPVTMVLPTGWFVDEFEGEIIWENEETGSIVKPCIDVNNTEIFHWNKDTDALIPGPLVR